MTDTLTNEDLNKRLPLIESIAKDLVEDWQQALKLRAALESDDCRDPDDPLHNEVSHHLERIERFLGELSDLGGRVLEFRRGYLGFDGQLDGRPVTYSWKIGEPEVTHYHERHQAFEKRRPLETA